MARSALLRPTPEQTAQLEKAALQAIPAEVSLFDVGGSFLYATPTVVRDPVLRDWLIGRTLHDWCRARGHPPSIADGRRTAIAEVVEGGGVVTLEEVRKAPLGGERRFVMAFAPLVDELGRTLGVISVGMESPAAVGSGDEQRQLHRQLQSLLEREERLVREVERLGRAGGGADDFNDPVSRDDGSLDRAGELLASVRPAVTALAATDAPVLLVGEWGGPVEGVARAIHQARSVGVFREVDGSSPDAAPRLAACVPQSVGAEGQPDGTRPSGNGGTLFVDHVAELSPEAQAHLLAILHGRDEGDASASACVRVVAGTRRDLSEVGETGGLLPEIANQLGALPLRIPPLRHRRDDVERLARVFLARAAGGLGRTLRALSIPEIERLQAYDWPGNEAELRCVMERAAILARGERPTILLPDAGHAPAQPLAHPDEAPYLTEIEMARRARQNLVSVLEHADWKIYGPDGAAALLGVRPTTLASRVKRAGLRAPELGSQDSGGR